MAGRVTPLLTTDVFIAGRWRPGRGGTVTTVNPATGSPLAAVTTGSAEDLAAGVAAARSQLSGRWGALSAAERARLVWHLAGLVERDTTVLARLDALDTGRPVARSSGVDIPDGVAALRGYTVGWPTDNLPEVVGAVFPGIAPTMATLRGLADGHTMVLRPYAHASLAVSHLAWLVEEAGFPAGVVNVVPTIQRSATGSPRVVADVHDFSQPVQVLVHRDGCDSAVAELVALAGEQVVGDPLDPATTVGPLRSAGERDQVLSWLAGASVVTGGRPLDRPGYFIEPTVVVGPVGAFAGPVVVVTPVGP